MNNKKILSVILLFAFFIFSPTLSTYFSQDDWIFLSHVYKQPFINIFHYYPEAFYRPVGQQLFFWIGSRIFGLEASGYHFMGLLVHLVNIVLLWRLFRYFSADKISKCVKLFLLLFYAINPAHFVALNWLTQVDLEIAVGSALLTVLFWKRTIFSLGFFLAALLSHETVAMLPIAMMLWMSKDPTLPRQGRILIKPAIYFCIGALVLIAKYVVNPFSFQSDYSLNFTVFGLLATPKWYALRAFMIPEGIRNFPVWLMGLNLIPGLILILIFRKRVIRGLGIYLLGVLPVLGFGGHLLAAYAIFGIALMVIELGKSGVTSVKHNKIWILSSLAITLTAFGYVYSNYLHHWSTGRGIVSQQLTREYIGAGTSEKNEILTRSNDFLTNPDIYFSSMMGRQYKVLDRGANRGVFDLLFYRGNDMTTQFLPDALFFKDSLLAGKFPLWNLWIFAGMPYFLDPQNFLWYPPNYILLLLPLGLGFLILLIGHIVFAGYFLKKLLTKFPAWIQWCGIFLYLVSPKLISHLEEGNWTLVIAACWLPMLYYALRKKKFWFLVISLSALIINNLNIGYYAVLFVFFYFIFLNLKRFDTAVAMSNLMALFFVAFLTLPRWLPLLIWGYSTVRANLIEAPLPLWSWTKVAKSLLFPLTGGHPLLQNEEILYIGIIPLVIFIIALIQIALKGRALSTTSILKGLTLSIQGQTLRSFWFLWIGFIVVVALNIKTPLFFFVEKLPGFSLLRITTRPWIFVAFATSVFAPRLLFSVSKKHRALAIAVALLVAGEYLWFARGVFSRWVILKDTIPYRFYQRMTQESRLAFAQLQRGGPVRAYCTTGCLDRLTAQNMGIALLGGNNPIQLTEFVRYLERAGGYREPAYHPILPPYTVFSSEPQPDAMVLGQTATKFVISPYQLTDNRFELRDAANGYFLYENKAPLSELKEYYFAL